MTVSAISRSALSTIGLATLALSTSAHAQAAYTGAAPLDQAEVDALPPEYRTGPAVYAEAESTIGADGVETITRTRRIEAPALPAVADEGYPGVYAGEYTQAYAPAYSYAPATVFQRDEWIDECERRTSGRGDREKGGIIGGLLGAIVGGVAGNRIADAGDRLGGTLIGAGIGGIGGLVLGQLIGGGRDRNGDYDCEAALDSYLSQYGQPGAYAPPVRVAARNIPAPQYAPQYAPPVPYGYGYGYAPAYGYSYAPPQQVVYVPVTYQQQQRVIVRETVREEVVPGAARTIPAPQPVPRPIKAQPIYTKAEPIPVKGY